MKVLVIPDIHGRSFWREAVKNNINKVDKIIFLGDYLDPYQDEIDENQETMNCNDFYDCISLLKMLEDIILLKKEYPDKVILLTGNHTDSYIWSNFPAASRTDYRHWEGFHKFFSQNLNLFNFVWTEDDVIFSHAGITREWASFVYNTIELPGEMLSVMEIALIFKNLSIEDCNKFSEYKKVLGMCSFFRGGLDKCGSCDWADIQEHIDLTNSYKDNIIPLGDDNVFQVFGHTHLKRPLITNKWICLDCKQGFIFDTITHDCSSCL